jgi:hypothetical protein
LSAAAPSIMQFAQNVWLKKTEAHVANSGKVIIALPTTAALCQSRLARGEKWPVGTFQGGQLTSLVPCATDGWDPETVTFPAPPRTSNPGPKKIKPVWKTGLMLERKLKCRLTRRSPRAVLAQNPQGAGPKRQQQQHTRYHRRRLRHWRHARYLDHEIVVIHVGSIFKSYHVVCRAV